MTMADMDRARDVIAAKVPPNAVRHGWNVADLTFDLTEERDTWSVRLLGPVEAWTEEMRIVGGPSMTILQMRSGPHGRLEARTVDDLASLVAQWFAAVGFE